ncbi:restriction endonuclease subunit S [Leptotrichia trevisanii]|uniref:restriction endonuclease subunit S n=1 Tax=Leptotrichia trevisanii TaxID=109328 RepID=UPI0026EC06B9|nr:restriction endonuclease subunit S [Leptotrichia trevisanii]
MEKTLENYFLFIRNGVSIKQFDGDGIPITRIESISNEYLNLSKLGYANIYNEDYKEYYLKNGDILMSHINSQKHLGKTAIIENLDMKIIHGMNLICLRADIKKIIPEYIFYFFKTQTFKKNIIKISKKSVNQASFSISDLKKIKVEVPALIQQERVVKRLNRIKKIIENRKKQIKLFDELIKSRFIEMFGDPIRNEKGWEISNFGKNFEISSGGTPSTKIMEYWENGDISWIGSNLCQNKILHENDGKYITELGYENSSAKLYEKGTILIALVGATIGKAALLKFSTATNQNIAGVEVDNNKFSSDFVFFVVQLLYPKFQGIGKNKFKMANLKFIKDLPIIIPPLYLQEEFSQFVEKTDKLKFKAEKSLKEMENLYDSLMQKFFKQ